MENGEDVGKAWKRGSSRECSNEDGNTPKERVLRVVEKVEPDGSRESDESMKGFFVDSLRCTELSKHALK